MDEAERAFRDGLHRVDTTPVPRLDPAELRTPRPSRGGLGRWLAAAAALVFVAGLGTWAFSGRGGPVPAIPAAPPSATSRSSAAHTASPGSADPTSAAGVQVRIRNDSSLDFHQVTVVFPTGEVGYGDIPAGSGSAYREVGRAYRYARIDLTANGTSYRLQPIDYVGETELGSGWYTYALTLDGRFVDLELEADR